MTLHILKGQGIVSFFGDEFPDKLFSCMGRTAFMLCAFLLFLLVGACISEEEPEVERPKVVVKIKNPERSKPLQEAAEAKQTEAKSESEIVPPVIDTPEEEKPPVSLTTDHESRPAKVERDDKGIYTVQEGDTLATIAGRKDIYDDPGKWPSLFLLNIDVLGEMKMTDHFDVKWSKVFSLETSGTDGLKAAEDFEKGELTKGLRLKFVTQDKAAQNVIKLGPRHWVVNVASSQNPKKIVPSAIALMAHGYRAYITKAFVKEQQWLRLRVGFYEKRSEAEEAGKKIMSILKIRPPWVVKIRQIELEEYGGYYPYPQDPEKRS
ncbi:MAG: SPOR domain-containing protein [Thermodesulfobacteriota bacterium]|nr:SPOR domain-containing protein [Thermodesulfobacteriota bacterium]